jgi:tetratricopeptide (TPR) repeat protein
LQAQTLTEIVAAARKRLPEFAREEAARIERSLISVEAPFSRDRNWWSERLTRFVDEYRGTEAALLAEVDIIGARTPSEQLEALDRFVEKRPGGVAAAKALHQKGFQLSSGNLLGTVYPRGGDPTERFMRVVAIVKELESGRYPRCEWVVKAPSLVIGFFIPRKDPIAPENVDRLVAALQEFVRTHWTVDARWPSQGGIGYVLTHKMADLLERKRDRISGMERVFGELERSVPDSAAVRYVRGLFYMQPVEGQLPDVRRAMLSKARETFAALSGEGSGLYHRRALATLAALHFEEGDYRPARDAFRKYVAAYPHSSWTWLAMLRAGQSEEEIGDAMAAAAIYLEAAERFADMPLARVLGYEYAARAYEAASAFEKAVAARERALAAWDKTLLRYTSHVMRRRVSDAPFLLADIGEVKKETLTSRLTELKRSLSVSGGAALEHGRWLLSTARYAEAIARLERVLREYPESPAATEARYLLHRARLERALHLADMEEGGGDRQAAMKELEALVSEPQDFAIMAAQIARASLLWLQGDATASERVMREALTARLPQQRLSTPAAGLEEDIAEIRRVVFLPRGGSIYGFDGWNAFSWPVSPPPFALVNADVRVKLHDDEVLRVTLVQQLPAAGDVIFLNSEQIGLFKVMIRKLGGTRRRAPGSVMETPNQPVGDSMQILRLWNKFFPARPGHWGGWEFETYPVISEIHFTNPERTKAGARVTIGYSGATVELEKENGKWIAKRLTSKWIT